MSLTIQQVEKLLLGSHKFEHLSFSLLLMRKKMLYATNTSPSVLQECAKEILGFLEKFKGTMSSDLAVLEKL